VSIPTTVDTQSKKASRYFAWGLWIIALCVVILMSVTYARANDDPQESYYVPKSLPPISPSPPDTTPPQAEVAPQSGSHISKITQIVVKFNESMKTESLTLDGDMAEESDGGKWSARARIIDNTLTISPKTNTQWKVGGQRTLTIDAKDLAGNDLPTLRLTYTVDAPPDTTPPTATVAPASGSDITQSNQIVINFNESMNPPSLALGGDMVAESDSGVWSTNKNKDDTLTISPKEQWNVGSQTTLTIAVSDIAGNPLVTLNLEYTVASQGKSGTLKWRFQTGGTVYSSPPIGADGTLYVGSTDHYIYALNPDGTLKWRFKTGDLVVTSPAIGADGTIYVGSIDNYIYALNPDGTLKWRFQTDDSVWSSPAIGADGTIYVGSQDGYTYALNPDGTLKWRFETAPGGFYFYSSSPAIGSDGTLYVGSWDDFIYALSPAGTLKWQFQMEAMYSSPAIGSDGTLYVGSRDKFIYALNPDGTLKWRFQTGSTVYSSPAIGADGTIYVGSADSYIYALNPDGTLKWRFRTNFWVGCSPAIGADGTIYVGSADRYMYALNPDGTLKWRFFLAGQLREYHHSSIGADGTVYIGSTDNHLYAIHGGTPLSTSAPWPKFHHNSQNTGRVSAGE
jgi:outer membrane protein assembly factor BamB